MVDRVVCQLRHQTSMGDPDPSEKSLHLHWCNDAPPVFERDSIRDAGLTDWQLDRQLWCNTLVLAILSTIDNPEKLTTFALTIVSGLILYLIVNSKSKTNAH